MSKAFLFPGQGNQKEGMGKYKIERIKKVFKNHISRYL